MVTIRNQITISTPEHVRVPFETAGIFTRSVAKLIDLICLGIFLIPIGLFIYSLLSILSVSTEYPFSSMIVGLIWTIVAFIPILYFSFTEYWLKGQTLGKRLLRLRVIADDGQHPNFSSIFLRNIIQLVDLLPGFYLLGMATIFFHQKEKRIGDLVAGTLVVQERDTRWKEITLYHTLLKLSKKEKQDFQKLKALSSEQFRILESFLARRKGLALDHRKRLAHQLIQMGWPDIVVYKGKEELFLEKIYLYLRETLYVSNQPHLYSEHLPK